MTPDVLGVLALAAGAVLAGAVSWWLRRIGIALYGPNDLDWPPVLDIGVVMAGLLAGTAALLAVVLQVALIIDGGLSVWTLALPAAAVAYAVRRVNAYVRARLAERDR